MPALDFTRYPIPQPIASEESPVNGDHSRTFEDVEVRLLAEDINVIPEPSDSFVSTPYIESLTARALTYLEVGYALHFAGPAGTGKTTLGAACCPEAWPARGAYPWR